MQLDKPRSPYRIKNIDPNRSSPIKQASYTAPYDRNRIMEMHQILHGKVAQGMASRSPTPIKSNNTTQRLTKQQIQIPKPQPQLQTV